MSNYLLNFIFGGFDDLALLMLSGKLSGDTGGNTSVASNFDASRCVQCLRSLLATFTTKRNSMFILIHGLNAKLIPDKSQANKAWPHI